MTINTLNFKSSEHDCPCCKTGSINTELLVILELVRLKFGKPVYINSGLRCVLHNEVVGGAKNSYHLSGDAVDIDIAGLSPRVIYNFLDSTFNEHLGLILYNTFVHIDTRKSKYRKIN